MASDFSFSSMDISRVKPSLSLFYAYLHDVEYTNNRHVLTFSSATKATEWWEAVQKLEPEARKNWTRPSAQLFAYRAEWQNSPFAIWRHKDMAEFKPHCMFTRVNDGEAGQTFQTLPLQWEDGYEVGSKYSYAMSAHFPGQGGENGKEAEEEAQKQYENAQKRQEEMEKEGKPITW